jgi:GNAT superfamily N-acetyltransferase
MNTEVARKMHRTLEAYHGMIYFVPEARAEYERLGLARDQFFKGYFASRAAAMGAVPGEVVVATFFNFHPDLVRAAVPSCWELASPAEWQQARRRGADAALRRMLGEALESPDMDEASSLARSATSFCSPAGRALFAGHLALDWPAEPHMELWHAITLLREYRGDGHISALVTAGITPTEALVLHDATGMLPTGVLQQTRSWSDDEWEAARVSLRKRGWMAGGELNDTGREVRDAIERQTDELAMAPWEALGESNCHRLRELVRPLSKAIVAGAGFEGVRQR